MKNLINKYIEKIKVDYPEDDKLYMDLEAFAKETTKQCTMPDKEEIFKIATELSNRVPDKIHMSDMNKLNKQFNDLTTLKSTPYLSQEWLEETNAKPTKVALWVIKKRLQVCTVYWEGSEGGVWEDENARSVCEIILDLPKKEIVYNN